MNQVITPPSTAELELAHGLIQDLQQPGLTNREQAQQEAELADMAIGDLSPEAVDIVMRGIYERAKLRHPSMHTPSVEPTLDLRGDSPVLDIRDTAKPSADAPNGYSSMEYLFGQKATLKTEQFDGVIKALRTSEPAVQVEVTELVTDTGKKVRLVDLRPYMTSSVRKSGPTRKGDIARLNMQVLQDIKVLVEKGTSPNTVTGVPRVGYTKFGGTKIRAYWMPVKDEANSENVLTIARLADCGNSVSEEQDLYRALFGLKLKK